MAERAGATPRLQYEVADLCTLPFPDESFDLVWSEHVMMNVEDRTRAYQNVARVLRPGGLFAFYEPVAISAETLYFPTPWAETERMSHLATRDAIEETTRSAGLQLLEWRDTTQGALDAFSGQAPQPDPTALGLGLAMGPRFSIMARNFARNVQEGRLMLVMGLARRASS